MPTCKTDGCGRQSDCEDQDPERKAGNVRRTSGLGNRPDDDGRSDGGRYRSDDNSKGGDSFHSTINSGAVLGAAG